MQLIAADSLAISRAALCGSFNYAATAALIAREREREEEKEREREEEREWARGRVSWQWAHAQSQLACLLRAIKRSIQLARPSSKKQLS